MSDLPAAGEDQIQTGQASGAGKWILFTRVAAQLSQVIVFLLAARFLSPVEFGLFALVQAFSAILFVAASAGWREVIISTATSEHELNQLMSFSFLSGLVMALIGVLLAAGLIWNEQSVAGQLALLFSACVMIAPAVSAANGILVRQGKVANFAVSTIAAEAIAFCVTVCTLVAGLGMFALALGKIVFLALSAGLLFWQARWSGRISFRGPRTRLLLTTSAHILANRTIFTLQTNGSTFLVGAFLGPAGVGYFRAAERVLSSVAELVMEPLRMIAWVELRRVADQTPSHSPEFRTRLAQASARMLPLLVFLAAPVFIGLALTAPALVEFALGPSWAPSGPVASILSLAALSVIPGVLAEPLLSLTGQIRHLSRVLLINAGVMVACMVVLGPFGLYALAAASLPAALFSSASIFWLLRRHGGFAVRPALERTGLAVLPLAAMALAVIGLQWILARSDVTGTAALALQVAAGAAAYLGIVYLMKPEALLALRRL